MFSLPGLFSTRFFSFENSEGFLLFVLLNSYATFKENLINPSMQGEEAVLSN